MLRCSAVSVGAECLASRTSIQHQAELIFCCRERMCFSELRSDGAVVMAFKNRVTDRLGIEHPVLLAPMDVVSGGRLAAAVSQAGGLGLLGGGYGDGEWLERKWARAGNARIGCGFITWSLAKRPELLDSVLRHQPAVIMLSFGDPRPFAPAIRAAGARLICQVQTVAQAREATEAGADVIVAQGTEAGGHGQSEPLLTLLPRVVDACSDIPVVAAGGIADGRGLAAAMMLGAEGGRAGDGKHLPIPLIWLISWIARDIGSTDQLS